MMIQVEIGKALIKNFGRYTFRAHQGVEEDQIGPFGSDPASKEGTVGWLAGCITEQK
jgi:hypothetical protein